MTIDIDYAWFLIKWGLIVSMGLWTISPLFRRD